ncbi:nicotinate-nucleotide adenylyltransferase [Methylomonas sp. TEB]|uniref:nicotinate-nucleotide adenylyltransferase n=1 Tax=Methylomonas sp. TEB TaxID=3398229 RepID=UPI0039F4FAA1
MIGVYGGTFNPVHYGHLRTALEVKELFELEQLRLIPCRLPAHRDEPDVPAHLRLQMLEAAVADTHGFNVDRRELDRAGPSYMVDTLHSLRNEIGNTPLLLFIGADAFAGLERWHQWQGLFDYAHIVVMTRPGYAGSALSAFLQQRIAEDRAQLSRQNAGLLTFQEVTALAISATAIRELVAVGRDPQFLLPDRVIELIRRHHLYQPLIHHTGN